MKPSIHRVAFLLPEKGWVFKGTTIEWRTCLQHTILLPHKTFYFVLFKSTTDSCPRGNTSGIRNMVRRIMVRNNGLHVTQSWTMHSYIALWPPNFSILSYLKKKKRRKEKNNRSTAVLRAQGTHFPRQMFPQLKPTSQAFKEIYSWQFEVRSCDTALKMVLQAEGKRLRLKSSARWA